MSSENIDYVEMFNKYDKLLNQRKKAVRKWQSANKEKHKQCCLNHYIKNKDIIKEKSTKIKTPEEKEKINRKARINYAKNKLKKAEAKSTVQTNIKQQDTDLTT